MALIVQTGDGIADANGYISLDEFKQYWIARAVVFDANDAVIGGAIVTASQYVDLNFSFKGEPATPDQVMAFPRDAWPGEIPTRLRYAVAEYAARELNGGVQPDVQRGAQVVKETKSFEGLGSKTVEYSKSDYTGQYDSPMADKYLTPLLNSAGKFSGYISR